MLETQTVQRAHQGSEKLIETTNALHPEDLARRYFSQDALGQASKELMDCTGDEIQIELIFARDMSTMQAASYEACFQLVQESSANDYKTSEIKWSPSKKRQEMLLPDMRYLVLSRTRSNGSTTKSPTRDPVIMQDSTPLDIVGFVSFMFTYEDGYEVVYIYEIHLAPNLQGQGVGRVLMSLVEEAGHQAGVAKCMLTVFKANKRAVKWYERRGYQIDDFSPGPRVLRNGKIKQPTYLILSKPCQKDLVK